MFGYRVPAPDQAMLISGGKAGRGETPFRVVIGHAVQTELALRAAELRRHELLAEVVRPAEAEAERVRILALAHAERMRIEAEAAASHDRVALDRMLIDQLPEIVAQAASGLRGAHVTVLNGTDGLGEIAAGLVSQGLSIFDSVRRTPPPTADPVPGSELAPRPSPVRRNGATAAVDPVGAVAGSS